MSWSSHLEKRQVLGIENRATTTTTKRLDQTLPVKTTRKRNKWKKQCMVNSCMRKSDNTGMRLSKEQRHRSYRVQCLSDGHKHCLIASAASPCRSLKAGGQPGDNHRGAFLHSSPFLPYDAPKRDRDREIQVDKGVQGKVSTCEMKISQSLGW